MSGIAENLNEAAVLRIQVEDFLSREMELLDQWRLPEWLELFTEDGRYEIPVTDVDPDASPERALFYVADDRFRLGERVARLMKKTAHSEYPRSRTRHMISNIHVISEDEGTLEVRACFHVFRTKAGVTDQYFGSYRYKLIPDGESFRVREKRCLLDSDGLRQQGRISIIL